MKNALKLPIIVHKMAKYLAVFDFDHTIIQENSDVVLRNLLPKDVLKSEKLVSLRPTWTAYMAEIFRLLPQNGVTPDFIVETCRKLEPVDGMLQLFQYLRDINATIIIISDANSEIIKSWTNQNLPSYSIEVFTNPAVWDGDVLKVRTYHQQTTCRMCPVNLCKGLVLKKYLDGRHFDKIMYSGDGSNDLCPSMTLRNCDLVFPRINFKLDGLLKTTKINAQVHAWSSATEIKEILIKSIEKHE